MEKLNVWFRLAGIFVYLTSEIIISFFTNDLEVIRRGALYLQVAALIGPVYPVFLLPLLYSRHLKDLFTVCI